MDSLCAFTADSSALPSRWFLMTKRSTLFVLFRPARLDFLRVPRRVHLLPAVGHCPQQGDQRSRGGNRHALSHAVGRDFERGTQELVAGNEHHHEVHSVRRARSVVLLGEVVDLFSAVPSHVYSRLPSRRRSLRCELRDRPPRTLWRPPPRRVHSAALPPCRVGPAICRWSAARRSHSVSPCPPVRRCGEAESRPTALSAIVRQSARQLRGRRRDGLTCAASCSIGAMPMLLADDCPAAGYASTRQISSRMIGARRSRCLRTRF